MDLKQSLEELTERYHLAVSGTDAGIWDWDLRNNEVFFSDRWKTMIGFEPNEIGDTYMEWESRVHPDDLPACLAAIDNYLDGKTKEYHIEHRLLCKNGHYIWISSRGAAQRDENGKPYRFVGSHLDITKEKKAERDLKEQHHRLQRLLEVQDKERKLVSYEIHDGLAQDLAGLLMQLENIVGKCKGCEAYTLVHSARDLAKKAFTEARQLIGDLRPPVLDDGGAIPAILQVVENLPLDVELKHNFNGARFEPILENSIFRIVQEAIQNTAQHSGSKHAAVELNLEGEIIIIKIMDWGKGFDVEAEADGHFGLIGIRERVESFSGQCSIMSSENGTGITITLPALGVKNGISKD